jgi:hypothetical protein
MVYSLRSLEQKTVFCLLFTTQREKMRSLEVNFFVTQSVSLPREERVPPRAKEKKKASRTARVSFSIASLKI